MRLPYAVPVHVRVEAACTERTVTVPEVEVSARYQVHPCSVLFDDGFLLRLVSGPVRAGYGVMTLRPAQRALPRLLQPSRRVLRGVPGDSPVAPVAYASEAERVIAARQQSEPPIRHPLLLVNNLEADAAFNLGGCRRAFVLESKPLGLLLGHGRGREHVVNGCRLSRVHTRLNLAAANLRREGGKRCKDRLLNYKCVLYTLARGAGPNGWFSLASCRRPSQTKFWRVETKESCQMSNWIHTYPGAHLTCPPYAPPCCACR